jgi:deoxycytidine triphosphate deaminase
MYLQRNSSKRIHHGEPNLQIAPRPAVLLNAHIIDSGRDDGFNVASYDLHARYILKAPSKISELPGFMYGTHEIPENGVVLESQGMIRVVSSEYLRMPNNVVGYALTKNGLSNVCVLAINIGVIDPGYHGPISSTLINFGKEPFVITRDTKFLRLTFHLCTEDPNMRTFKALTHDQYVARTADEVRRHSSDKFLNLAETAKVAGEQAFGKYRNWAIAAATILAGVLAVVAIFAPIAAAVVQKYVDNSAITTGQEIRAKYEGEIQSMDVAHKKEIQELEKRVHDLELRRK